MQNFATGNVLLVEDHPDISEMIADCLARRGFSVECSLDGVSGLHLASTGAYDVIVLDLMLPGMGGLEVTQRLRKSVKKSTPILMLTARDKVEDKLKGLDAGADDYLVKPFEMPELEARLMALIRRVRRQLPATALQVGDLSLDMSTLQITRAGEPIEITPIGLKVLQILMRESPHTVTRKALEDEVWGDSMAQTATLRSHLYHLRLAIDKPFAKRLIHTCRPSGYRIADV